MTDSALRPGSITWRAPGTARTLADYKNTPDRPAPVSRRSNPAFYIPPGPAAGNGRLSGAEQRKLRRQRGRT